MAKGWLSSITTGGVAGTVSYLTANYILPYGVPIVTGIAGWVGDFPWFYTIIGVSFAAATVFTTLVMWDEWKIRTRVENKIGFRAVQFGNDVHGEGITVGLVIDNLANFPIDFEVYELMAKIDDKVPKNDHKAGQVHTMPPKGVGWHHSHAIKINDPPKKGTLDGFFSFKIRYGRLKNLKYTFSQKKSITVKFNEKGELAGGTFSNFREDS